MPCFYALLRSFLRDVTQFVTQKCGTQFLILSDHNFLNLWCELNKLCYEVDESFPDPYDDHELLKSFCQAHPYYFIDILDPGLITDLLCEYLDDRLNILVAIIDKEMQFL